MIKALRKLLGLKPKVHPIEQAGLLTRQRIEDTQWAGGKVAQYQYWCECGTKLTDGPRGGAAVNAVCEKCKVNWGNLEGYWGR